MFHPCVLSACIAGGFEVYFSTKQLYLVVLQMLYIYILEGSWNHGDWSERVLRCLIDSPQEWKLFFTHTIVKKFWFLSDLDICLSVCSHKCLLWYATLLLWRWECIQLWYEVKKNKLIAYGFFVVDLACKSVKNKRRSLLESTYENCLIVLYDLFTCIWLGMLYNL